MEKISIMVPVGLLKEMNALVDEGLYKDISEVAREGIRNLVMDANYKGGHYDRQR